MKPVPCSTSFAGQVGRDHRREAFREQHVQRVTLQASSKQHGVVLEKVKAVAGDAGAALEVDQVELFAQRDVVERLEVELGRRRFAARRVPGCPGRRSHRRGRVREIGNRVRIRRLRLG